MSGWVYRFRRPSPSPVTPRLNPETAPRYAPPCRRVISTNPHTRAAEQPPVGNLKSPQPTRAGRARSACLGRLGSESRRRDPHSGESPPSRLSETALRGKVVASSYIGFVLATSRRRQNSDGHARATTPYGEIPEAIRPESEGATRPDSERHARVPRTLAHIRGEGHAAPTTHTRTPCDPGSFRILRVQNPLVDSHAPSGWLVDRAAGLRARTLSTDAAPRTSPVVSIYNRGRVE